MPMLRKIKPSDLQLNMIFSAPVFFEDGKQMFLAKGKTVKAYHLFALKRWKIPFLLTEGHSIEQGEGSNIEQMAGFDKKRLEAVDDVEEIEPLEEL